MKKLFVIAVMLGGALVAGCSPVVGAQAPSPGAEAPIASTRQAVVSEALEAALTCVQGYVDAGTCDWAHWSEMYDVCETYNHPELDDELFIGEVQAGRCTSANWPTLRGQLVAPRVPASVLVRAHCDSTSEVMPETEFEGCHTLAGTEASFVSVTPGKTVTLYAGEDCTGDSIVVQADTNLCETSYASGASANDNVRSFRVQDAVLKASAARYDCGPNEPMCVTNYNGELASINSTHTVKIVRVTQSGRTTPSMADIKSNINWMYDFFKDASRNQVSLNLLEGSHQTVSVPSGSNCNKAESQARKAALNTDAFLTVYMFPNGLCTSQGSHSDSRRIYLAQNLRQLYAHETGHVLGLNHGNHVEPDGTVVNRADPTTWMGRVASDNYNLPQLHWLGWTKKEELVLLNPAIEDGSAYELSIRPVGRNTVNGGLPLGAVWEIPNTGNRLFIAVPKARTTAVNQVEGGAVYVYRAPKCVGCTGMQMGTTRLAVVGAKSNTGHIVGDIVITPVRYERTWVQEGGKNTEDFSSVTLRIRRSAPVVLTPADGSVTSNNRPTFSGTAEAGLKVNVSVDGVKVATTTATAEGTWSYTSAAALAPGVAHTVRATATDADSTLSPSSSTHTFTVNP